MPTIKFDDFLKEKLKDPKFKARFEKESANLESAIVIAKPLFICIRHQALGIGYYF